MINKDKAFCAHCGHFVSYSTTSQVKQTRVRGKVFVYEKTRAICDECSHELYVPKINDMNVDAINSSYET
jgi:hypothetical protein